MRKRLQYGILLGLLFSSFTAANATEDTTSGPSMITHKPMYVYSDALNTILGEKGKKYRKHFIEAATLFDVPVDILAASVKTESDFEDRARNGGRDNLAVGLAQVT